MPVRTPVSPDDLALISAARSAAKTGLARDVRLRASLSQNEIAQACGVSPAAVSRWEAGVRKPRGAAAKRYAHLIRLLEQTTALDVGSGAADP